MKTEHKHFRGQRLRSKFVSSNPSYQKLGILEKVETTGSQNCETKKFLSFVPTRFKVELTNHLFRLIHFRKGS